jgi:hypothetical protein
MAGSFTTIAPGDAVFTTYGTITNAGAFIGDFVKVDVRLIVDGVMLENRRYDVEVGTFSRSVNWNYAVAMSLPAGVHNWRMEAQVYSASVTNPANPYPTTVIGGPSYTVDRGGLTVSVVNK